MPIESLFQNSQCEWIDVEAPNAGDLDFLQVKYGIDMLLLEDTIDRDHLPKYEESGDIRFFLTRQNTDMERRSLGGISDVSTKLGIFLLPGTIITVHRLKTATISGTLEEISTHTGSDEVKPDRIAILLGLKVLKSFNDECDNLMQILDKLEHEVFLKHTNESEVIRRLYHLKRKSGLNMRLLNISGEWVHKFRELDLNAVEVADLKDKHTDVSSDFDHLNSQVNSLISMFLALSDQKANQVMKLLTQFSVYFLPVTFIAGVYGMNFQYMPELQSPYGYFFTLAGMAVVVIIIYLYMRRKRW
ncbi:magnesium transporter CorA [Chryseobacterium sp. cx-311]|uniref:CorA family divalent cation transporter n=1 Tax=Marnyiella aurantia TaxID=2758037 RepID=UPI001AE651EC|nr:CorA family divalent cation transporter [Marnyiella aurantia]MBP0611838.1 magnesium transporter CorA [Marnyiella aurantia]